MYSLYCRSCRSRFESYIWTGRCDCGSQKIQEIIKRTPLDCDVSEHHFYESGEEYERRRDKGGAQIRKITQQYQKEMEQNAKRN